MLCMLARPLGLGELAGLGGGPASGSLHGKRSDQTCAGAGLGQLKASGAQQQRAAVSGVARITRFYGSKGRS